MKKNKQEIKEKQMAMAIKALSHDPLQHYPSEEEFAEIGKLLVMAYENYPRFFSFGLVCWRDYKKARAYRKYNEHDRIKNIYDSAFGLDDVSRGHLKKLMDCPEGKKLYEDWLKTLRNKKVNK